MKSRFLTVLLALGILASSNAFASRARILVMGQGDGGFFLPGDTSFFIDDARDIFYNPSYVNDYKNWGIIEKSNSPGVSGEGGMVTSISQFSLGLYFNRGDELVGPAGTGFAAAQNMRPIDVLFGGDMGTMKWGVGLNYGNNDVGGGSSVSQGLMVRAGIQIMDLEPFAWYRAIGNDYGVTGNPENQSDKSYGVGVRYKMGEWTPWAGYRADKVTNTPSSTDTAKANIWTVGLGRNTKVAEGARMAYSVAFVHAVEWNNGAVIANNGSTNVIPFDLAVEGDAASWLTVRAGLGFNWWDRTADMTLADNTSARIGATMHLGKADFEFAVGRNAVLGSTAEFGNGGGNSNTGAVTGSSLDSQSFDIASGFFTAADIQYHW